ncbi:MAG: transglycosylase domain-containing protein, partial [Pyrinomonadaceae bacterium]
MSIEVTSVHERRRPRVIKAVGSAVRRGAKSATRRKLRIIIRSVFAAVALTVVIAVIFLAHSYNSYAKIVDARLAHGYLTSHAGLYAAPRTLRTGQTLSPDQLVALLRRAGYVEQSASDVWSGSFTSHDQIVEIRPRRLSLNSSRDYVPDVVRVAFNNKGRIEELNGDAVSLDSYTLEPELLTSDASMKAGQRSVLSFQNIPPVLVHAITSIEDRRFFEHSGLDIFGVGRALLRNAGDERMGQGGSTITQQLVKNSYLSPERTLRRKFAEAMLAFTLERRLSKEDIFALYCNEIYLGQRGAVGVRGVEQAARVFFGKELKELSLAEAATIAGMIQSPNRYAPDRHEENAVARRNTVINSMLRDGWVTKEDAAAASNEPLKVVPADNLKNESLAPYFVDYVNRAVEHQLDARGVGEESAPRIYTTIDLDLQQIAEDAIKHQLERLDKVYKGKATPQAAFVALDPKTGNVLAMVGGRDYAASQLNRATDALRQPGSVYKPFVYATALESSISPVQMFTDAPQEFVYARNAKYRPANYGGGYSMRDVTMRTGLVKSLNVVTVDVAMRTGLSR